MEQLQNLPIKIVLDNWNSTLTRACDLINSLSEEEMLQEASPGKNTGAYLLGHLTAVNDRMLSLLGLGAIKYPELYDIFITSPDKSGKVFPSVAELRTQWSNVNEALTAAFNNLKPEEWLQKHTSVSEEDFIKEPHRNKLNVLLSRTIHLASHYGQMLYLKKGNSSQE